MLVDIHCHLDHEYFKDKLNDVIKRARQANVNCILTSGVNKESNRKVLGIARKYNIVRASLGLYPIDALKLEKEAEGLARDAVPTDADEDIDFIRKNKADVFAIGEIGLDYSLAKDKAAQQKEIFLKMLHLAEQIKKPVIIHSRKAEADALEILQSSKLKKVVMHCFTAKMSLVKKAYDLGFLLSIPPVITRLQHFQNVVKEMPLTYLLTETDAPYLSPFREKRNEPAFVAETIRKIAEIKGITKEETENIIFSNFQRTFLQETKSL